METAAAMILISSAIVCFFFFVKIGSIPSLGAGLLFGSALAYGAWQVSQDASNYSLQLTTSSILAGVMGYRFYNSGKIMPAGAVCAISIVMILRIAFNAVTAPNKSLK